jgi:hypothetical protein
MLIMLVTIKKLNNIREGCNKEKTNDE